MGLGEIISHDGAGQYQVKIKYGGRDRVQARINNLNARISDLEDKIAAETDPIQIRILTLQKTALEIDVEYLENGMPDDPTIPAWCADMTEDLSGNVGTIEIPGEDQFINIQPGYDGNASYAAARDGQLFPAIACSPDQAFFNKAIMPGWQKWKPTYRYATILDIDYDNELCSIQLIPAGSSQQSLDVNQGEDLQIGTEGTEYQISEVTVPGWEQFKVDYAGHPLVTNTEQPETLPSTDSLVESIKAMVLDVRSKHLYKADPSFKKIDASEWNIMSGDDPNASLNDRGDCEDFALTYADKLINDLGLSPRNLQVALCWTLEGEYHANLVIPTTSHGTLVLDNNLITGVKTKAQLDAIGYFRWDKFLINGNQWASDSREILSVPIEYMDCGATAFSLGDLVIVKFVDQDFDQPKVIGFASDPVACGNICYSMDGPESGWRGVLGYNPNSDVFTRKSANINEKELKVRYMAAFSFLNGIIHAVGGEQRETVGGSGVTNLTDNNREYDSAADSLSMKNDLSYPIANVLGISLSETEGLIAGGTTGDWVHGYPDFDWWSPTGVVSKYDRPGDSWQSRNNIGTGNFYSGQFAVGGIAYVIQGWRIANGFINDEGQWEQNEGWQFGASMKFNDAINSWSMISDSFPNWYSPNSWGNGGKGWIAQGVAYSKINSDDFHVNYVPPDNPNESWITSANFSYDPATNSWSTEQKNNVSGGFGWLGLSDVMVSERAGIGINVALGSGGGAYGGDVFDIVSKTWGAISTAQDDSTYRRCGSSCGGVGM
jgi:hypothetical protein